MLFFTFLFLPLSPFSSSLWLVLRKKGEREVRKRVGSLIQIAGGRVTVVDEKKPEYERKRERDIGSFRSSMTMNGGVVFDPTRKEK